jgi:hypothetical protein
MRNIGEDSAGNSASPSIGRDFAAMTLEAAPLLARIATQLAAFRRVALLSPSDDERAMFPTAIVITGRDWDLDAPRPDLRFDLIIAGRTGQYSRDSARRLANVLASCRVLLLAHGFSHQISERSENGSGNARGGLALIRGALTHPLIRIDDYPSGIRPILLDLKPLHEILKQFEARRIPYHLGIVPAILNDHMISTLRRLTCMIPAQHGFDHCYPRYSALLERKRDPYNERGTVGGFNEFSWQSTTAIERKLRDGKALLERELGRAVDEYIPPCNRCNRRTARLLKSLGFKLCLSEKPVPGHFVPGLRSDFYGRSAELTGGTIPEVLGLHVTWEWDLQRKGDMTSLPSLLDRIVAETEAKDAAIAALASECRQLT